MLCCLCKLRSVLECLCSLCVVFQYQERLSCNTVVLTPFTGNSCLLGRSQKRISNFCKGAPSLVVSWTIAYRNPASLFTKMVRMGNGFLPMHPSALVTMHRLEVPLV